MRWPFVGRRERLRRQASDWIARLNGAHDGRDRAAFEQWYRADPEHAATYDRLAALFAAAGDMRVAPAAGRPPAPRASRGWRPRYALAALAGAVGLALLAFAVLDAREAVPSDSHAVQVAVFKAAESESRRIVLVDGSEVTLSPGSELDVTLDGSERRLRLLSGEGRFAVAHETRPFVVAADATEIVARGTRFVVRLGDAGTLVSLIEGRVEVTYPPSAGRAVRRVTRLTAGQRIVVPRDRAPPPVTPGPPEPSASPAMIEFDDTRLADAIEQVNRHSAEPIRLADSALAGLRVTGAFRAGDAPGFAESVAAAFGLRVERGGDGVLWLTAGVRAPAGAPSRGNSATAPA